ncbi:MAG: DUF975 family protein [Oscillospiraceae bacterium]|nr:DUF975 family protein [Oscillospiraceae bacterium]
MDISEIKSKAKEMLKGNWLMLFGALVFVQVLATAFGFIPPHWSRMVPSTDLLTGEPFEYDMPLGGLGSYIWIVLNSIFILGVINMFLGAYRGEKVVFKNVFSGFANWWRAILLGSFRIILICVFFIVSIIPLAVAQFYAPNLANQETAYLVVLSFGLALTFFLIGWTILKAVRFSQSMYVLSENPEIKFMDAIRKSDGLMVGKFWKYITLHISFAGWLLVYLVVYMIFMMPFGLLGISEEMVEANIWYGLASDAILVIPFMFLWTYVRGAQAVFYKSLKANDDEE